MFLKFSIFNFCESASLIHLENILTHLPRKKYRNLGLLLSSFMVWFNFSSIVRLSAKYLEIILESGD